MHKTTVDAVVQQHTTDTPYLVGEAHFYTTEINGDLVLFDTGPNTPANIDFMGKQVDIRRLKYVFITHSHVDHYGLAAFLSRNSDAEVILPRKDAIKFRESNEQIAYIRRLLNECGYDDEFAAGLSHITQKEEIFPAFPERYSIVEESDVPERLGISWLSCPGHSQSDFVYLLGNHAVTGDILLRNIFQAPLLDLDLETFSGRFRNYYAYCDSLLKIEKLRGYEIHPGHRFSVDSVDDTVLFYVRKLIERAGQVKRFAGIKLVRDVIAQIFGDSPGDTFVTYLKLSQILFMRDFLAEPERLRESLEHMGLFEAVRDLYAAVVD
ncbi:MAG: MBL fold metallo-hydrolase [Dissulfurispiraceae bacterium]